MTTPTPTRCQQIAATRAIPQQIVIGTETLTFPPVLLGFAVPVAKLFE
jgi:hypothetical protein